MPLDPAPDPAPSDEAPPSRLTIAAFLERITPHAWVTPTLVALVVIGFGVETALGASPLEPTAAELLKAGGNFGPSVLEGQWWRVASSIFIHAGLLHLAFNVWAFWSIGRFCERVFGNLAFLAIYVLSGFGGALASLAVHPLTVCVGASGAIFGVYGATLAFVLLHKGVFPDAFLQQQRNSLLGFLAFNVVFGLRVPNIDLSAHGGGFVTGMLAGALVARDLASPEAHVARRLLGVVGVAAALLGLSVGVHRRLAAVPEISADRLAGEAFKHLKAGELPEAVDLYTQALALEPDDGWLSNRGLAHLMGGRYGAALQDFRAADAAEHSARSGGLVCEAAARAARSAADLEAAVRFCTDAIARDPKNPEPLAWRASVYEDQKEASLALADATAALALDPESDLALRIRLHLYLDLESDSEAEVDCVALLKHKAPGAAVFGACGLLALRNGDDRVARERLDGAIALEPKDHVTRLARALLHDKEGRPGEARADYEALVAADPGSAVGLNNLAWVEIQLRDYPSARRHADQAVALDGDDAAYRGTRCFALAGLGEVEAAREDCALAVKLNPDSDIDRGMLAFLERRAGDARRSWKKATLGAGDAQALAPWLEKLEAR